MIAHLCDSSSADHHNLVGVANRAQSVSDRNDCLSLHETFECIDHKPLRFSVKSSGRFIEKKDGTVSNHDASDADPLTLASGEGSTALTNHRAARVIGLVSFLLSVVLWLPIPLGNHVPALAMTLFALALIYRDGVLVILAAVAAVASVVLVSVTLGAAAWAVVHLWNQVFG